jgi:hypothetical protein
MHRAFGHRTEQVMTLAAAHARRLNHDFVGTEHILLGLVGEESREIADVLSNLGAAPEKIEQEIVRLVQPGPNGSAVLILPLTPRANAAIDFAHQEAAMLSQRLVEPEHLLLGLLRESDGVAGMALRNLGLDPDKIRPIVLKDRLAQLALIERIVRPVHTPIARKRKIREELLAHFEGIIEEELAKAPHRTAAMEAAAKRLGDPGTVAAEIGAAVTALDRCSYFLERWLGWRAPESVFRYMLRVALRMYILEAIVICPFILIAVLKSGLRGFPVWQFQFIAAFLFSLPIGQFCIGLLYFKMRDTLWGVFGSRRSAMKLFLLSGAMAVLVATGSVIFVGLATGKLQTQTHTIVPIMIVALLTPVGHLCIARFRGPKEISDTIWVCLPIEKSNPEVVG